MARPGADEEQKEAPVAERREACVEGNGACRGHGRESGVCL